MLKQILEEEHKLSPGVRTFSRLWSWGWLIVILGLIGLTVSHHLSRSTFRWTALGNSLLVPLVLLLQHLAWSFPWPPFVRRSLEIGAVGCLVFAIYLLGREE